jgi:predicted metalloprotease with PDZ domain
MKISSMNYLYRHMIYYSINSIDQLPYQLEVKVVFEAKENLLKAVIPFWRPGRYERGSFPKNFIGLKAEANGAELETQKIQGNLMHIHAKAGDTVTVSYLLYSRELTAGNTYIDDELLLINPVNACLYIEGLESEPCELKLAIPEKWAVSTALERRSESTYRARDMQHFMDTPIMAAANVDVLKYEVEGVPYFIHLVGGYVGSDDQLVTDFRAFTQRQIEVFGSIPVKEYHFLIILLPHRVYHGVEHENSTVIILGPSGNIGERSLYKELLGVSSHELYHTWNIKYIRPADWTPYDFTQADYSRLGYVAEGVTTYMGDVMLWQSGVFSDEEYLNELAVLLKRHKDNDGRFNLSLADSSIDTWVDGYGRGTPRRRVSIYVEGALLAFVCDVWLLEATNGEMSLSNAMKQLYKKVDPAKGYTEEEYWSILSEMADCDWEALRNDVVDGKGHLERYVNDAMVKLGLKPNEKSSADKLEQSFGVKLQKIGTKQIVWNVSPNSPAERAGLYFDDEIKFIDGVDPEKFLSENESLPEKIQLTLESGFRKKTIQLTSDGSKFGYQFAITKDNSALFEAWKGVQTVKN